MIKKREVMGLLFVILFSFSIQFVLSDFEVGNASHYVAGNYGPSSYLKGWVNLSFANEPVTNIFEDSLGNSISLLELAQNNSGFVYSCSASDCSSDYIASNGETTKTFSLNNRESKVVGLKFSGEISSIDSINFIIDSNAPSSCYNQLTVDFLDDGTIDFGNYKSLSSSCGFLKSYGCFNETYELYTPTITNTPYCERVSVFESPGLELGAWVIEATPGSKKITMALYTLGGEQKKTCELEKTDLSGGREVSCDVDFLVTKPEDYYVCIYTDSGTGEYRTKGYASTGKNCGFYGYPSKQESNAYQIFAEAKSFAAVGAINISNSLSGGQSLNSLVTNYISEHYGSFDCSDDCVIPIRIISSENQQITIRNLISSYSKPGLAGIIDDKFHDLDETPSRLTSDFQKLYLNSANFVLPDNYGHFNYTINFDGKKIFSEDLSIENVPVIGTISPEITASAYPTLFTLQILNNNSIKFEWNFGDNETATTTTNQVSHTYSSSGNYELSVTVTDSMQRTSFKSFNVKVLSPEILINKTLADKLSNLNKVKNQIEKFDSFYQKQLNSVFDFDFIDGELKKIQRDYETATSEEDYNSIMTSLLKIKVPELVLTTKNADSIQTFSKSENIDLYILETVGGGTYDMGRFEDYINAVLLWNQENVNAKVSFKEISARYEKTDEPLIRFFEVDVSEKKDWNSNPFFIMKKLENLKFDKDYFEREESGFVYFELEEGGKIKFSTTEDVSFIDLPFFISPKISSLPLKEPIDVSEEETFSKWVLFISIMFVLVLAGLIVYVVLQRWYKNKYEAYLFKNRNNLYNLVIYIENSRKRGIKDNKIESKLRKAGWNSEQVSYAMKKHAGERTGMFELPIGGVLDLFKKKGIVKDKKNNFQIRFNQGDFRK